MFYFILIWPIHIKLHFIFWASMSSRFLILKFSRIKKKTHKHAIQSSPLCLIYGSGGCSKLAPIPWPQRTTGLLLVSHHPSEGAEAEDDTNGWGGPLLHSYVSCQTHLWNLSLSPLSIVLHHILASSGLIFKCVFLFFPPYFPSWLLEKITFCVFRSLLGAESVNVKSVFNTVIWKK